MTSIVVRTLIIYVLLVFSLRIMGKRQLGELEISELIVAVLISDIASLPLQDAGLPFLNSLFPIMALITINLGIFNLLPIPALDGGRIVCLLLTALIEAITRKKLDPKYEGYIHAVGMVLLLALMAVITFKDIFTIFKG